MDFTPAQQAEIKHTSETIIAQGTYILFAVSKRVVGNVYVVGGGSYIGIVAPSESPSCSAIYLLIDMSTFTITKPVKNTSYTIYYDYVDYGI